jgi:hypothetical protein
MLLFMEEAMDGAQKHEEHRVRKINAVLVGDYAVDAELLIVKLGLDGTGKKKADIDLELVNLALEALSVVVESAMVETGNKHPSAEDVRDIMGKRLVVARD